MSEVRAHDPGRFARAVALAKTPGAVVRMGAMQFRVTGHDEPEYFVDLTGDPKCYCGDMQNRGAQIGYNCKHVLAARLAMKDPTLDNSLMEFAYAQMQRVQELERRTRQRRKSA